MQFRSDEITALLRTQDAHQAGDVTEGSAAFRQSCDVSYVLFLEPREEPDPAWTAIEWIFDAVIKRFSPPPTLSHCELIAPPIPSSNGGRVHFATYLGRGGADWQNQNNKDEGISFYLIENGSRWRALPVFGPNAAEQVREAAQISNQTVADKYALISSEVMKVPANGEEVLSLKKYIGECLEEHDKLKEQLAFNVQVSLWRCAVLPLPGAKEAMRLMEN